MDSIINLIDITTTALEDILPTSYRLMKDLRDLLKPDLYFVVINSILILKLIVFFYIFFTMFYYLFIQRQLYYRDIVPIRLLTSIITIGFVIFILSDFKRGFEKVLPDRIKEYEEKLNNLVKDNILT